MKIKQKKLKAKHFRYLSKEYVEDPDRFLKEIIYEYGQSWSNNFNYLINTSLYPPMRADVNFGYGLTHLDLGKMIEAAFVIFEKCELKPIAKEDLFVYSSQSVFLDEIEDGKIFPEKMLRTFFGFKTLKEWLLVLDDLLVHQDFTSFNMHEIQINPEYIAIREFLVTLPNVLQEIYKMGGLQCCLPAKN